MPTNEMRLCISHLARLLLFSCKLRRGRGRDDDNKELDHNHNQTEDLLHLHREIVVKLNFNLIHTYFCRPCSCLLFCLMLPNYLLPLVLVYLVIFMALLQHHFVLALIPGNDSISRFPKAKLAEVESASSTRELPTFLITPPPLHHLINPPPLLFFRKTKV